jgi:hypothetical protein
VRVRVAGVTIHAEDISARGLFVPFLRAYVEAYFLSGASGSVCVGVGSDTNAWTVVQIVVRCHFPIGSFEFKFDSLNTNLINF